MDALDLMPAGKLILVALSIFLVTFFAWSIFIYPIVKRLDTIITILTIGIGKEHQGGPYKGGDKEARLGS